MTAPTLCTNCKHHPASHTLTQSRSKKAFICDECYDSSTILTRPNGDEFAWYTPQLHQRPYHTSDSPNLLALGTRATGKSKMMRADAIIRCMLYPGFKVLILRRKIPDLQKSHLRFINAEMKQLGDNIGYYRETTHDVKFANDSFIQFSHCETTKDVENYLSSEWDLIIFDELSSFTLEMFLLICAASRSPEDAPYKALVRAGSNPLGIGAQWMKEWFVDHDVDLAEYPDYNPDDFEMQFSTLHENKYVNQKEYEKRLRNLPDHARRAYLLGEFVIEGAYFGDFMKMKIVDGEPIPWHTIKTLPTWRDRSGETIAVTDLPWIGIYRSVDWGYFPDPAVCHWHLILPNKRRITFKERTWKRTLAADVARDIKKASEGMHVIDSYADPTMFIKTGNAPYSIGEIFEQNGVPLTASQNDRELYGYSVHEMLNTLIKDENDDRCSLPSWQILDYACPELVRTIPLLQMDKNDSRKIADGPDHWVVSCAYFAMGGATPSKDPIVSTIPRWMKSKPKKRRYA